MRIFADSEALPSLFVLGSGLRKEAIKQWEHLNGITLPDDIRQLWNRFGSGTIFETEDIFSPVCDVVTGENIDTITSIFRTRGLPDKWWILHRGLGGLTVIDCERKILHQVSEQSFEIHSTFTSVDTWYCDVLRREYALRYRLPPSPTAK